MVSKMLVLFDKAGQKLEDIYKKGFSRGLVWQQNVKTAINALAVSDAGIIYCSTFQGLKVFDENGNLKDPV